MPFVSNLGEAFRQIVQAYPARPALLPPGARGETYTELDRLSNQLAHLLIGLGLRRNDVVVIFHDKSTLAFAVMLACLKSGLIYTNVDPDSPAERFRKIVGACKPKVIVNTFPAPPRTCPQAGFHVVHLRHPETMAKLAECDFAESPKLRVVTGSDPAYIMFTSGSTGIPKGAVMSHANVLSFIAWARDRFELAPQDILSNVNPMFFDNSVFDFYGALFSGASLVPISWGQALEPRALVRLINEARCTIWFSVPSLLVYLLTTRALDERDFPSVRKIIFGGEGFPKPKLKQLYDLFGHRADLENVYGPTECTCICSAHTVVPSDISDHQALAPLGFLAPNFDYEILATAEDPNAGELFLRGPNVGLGYYDDPARTAGAFIQNPTHRRYSDVGYRTGDLVRRDNAGRLHFAGRIDFQIKHMGYRIELEEIEAALNTLPQVQECAVVYRKLGDGLGEIVGFATLSAERPSGELIREVAEILPSYMVPKRVAILEALPKNANGKIDRGALQAIAAS